MNLKQIRSEIRSITQELDVEKVQDSTINDFINRGQLVLADEAELFETTAIGSSVSGQSEYGLTSALLWIDEDDPTDTGTDVNEGSGVTASETTFDVDSGPAIVLNSYIKIDDEIMLVTNISSNTLTVTRGVAGTTAATHADDTSVYESGAVNLIRIKRIDFDDYKTTRIGYEQVLNQSNDYSFASYPTDYAYYVRDDKLGIFPTPTTANAIRLYCLIRPTVISSDSDTPDIDAAYHEALIYYGAWKMAERLNPKMIGYFKNEWDGWRRKVVQYGSNRYAEPSFRISYNDF